VKGCCATWCPKLDPILRIDFFAKRKNKQEDEKQTTTATILPVGKFALFMSLRSD